MVNGVVLFVSANEPVAMTAVLSNNLAINGNLILGIVLDVLPWRHGWKLLLDSFRDLGIEFRAKAIVKGSLPAILRVVSLDLVALGRRSGAILLEFRKHEFNLFNLTQHCRGLGNRALARRVVPLFH